MSIHNQPLCEEHMVLSDSRNEECGYNGMCHLLSLKERPTAVFAAYDTIALGAYRALTVNGLCVPEDVSLVSIDDSDFCRYLPQSLTSVNYDVAAECRVAVAILLNRIKEQDSLSVQSAAIIPRLIIRESSCNAE